MVIPGPWTDVVDEMLNCSLD